MQVIPLAADSMGARSMATYVETDRLRLLIDPGILLADSRYGLTPHPIERWTMNKLVDRIGVFAKAANAVAVTRWDPEHCSLERTEWYAGKRLFLKNPNLHVPPEPRKSAFEFIRSIRRAASDVSYADGRTFPFGKALLSFSESFPHPFDAAACAALALSVSDDEEDAFAFSSAVRGTPSDPVEKFLIARHPALLYLDGPPIRARQTPPLAQVWKRLRKTILESGARQVILDHHLLRDSRWRTAAEPIFRFGREHEIRIVTAAEYRGDEVLSLESDRKLLHERHAPKRERP
jgi:uncharacterized protein